jgi:hypothetical protein
MKTIVPMTAAALALAACGPGGTPPLDGSLTAVMDVTYSKATLEETNGFLALRFIHCGASPARASRATAPSPQPRSDSSSWLPATSST